MAKNLKKIIRDFFNFLPFLQHYMQSLLILTTVLGFTHFSFHFFYISIPLQIVDLLFLYDNRILSLFYFKF